MKNLFFFFSFLGFMLSVNSTKAQDFDSAVGLRLGYPVSISYKTFINDSHALEFYGGTRGNNSSLFGYRWYTLAAAYQVHQPLDLGNLEGLEWYFGGGLAAYFWNYDFVTDSNTTSFGIQGYLGLSYTFSEVPINLSVDWIPTIFIGNGYTTGFGGGYGSLAVRYILN